MDKKYTLYIFVFLFLLGHKSEAGENDTVKVNILNKLSWETRHQDLDKAMMYGQSAFELSTKLHYNKGIAYANKNLGVIYSIKAEYDIALKYYSEAQKRFEELNDRTEMGNIQNLFGLLNADVGKYTDAIFNYKKAIEIFSEINDEEGKAIASSNLGIIYYQLDRFDDALEKYLYALKIYEKLNNKYAFSNVYTNIGIIYLQQKNFARALNYYKLSLNIDIELNDIIGQSKSLTNIGVCYFDWGNLDSSEVYHNKALLAFKKLDDKKGISESYNNIGAILYEKEKLEEANLYYLKALEIKKQIGDQPGEIAVSINLGKLNLELKIYKLALQYLDTALQMANKIGALKYRADANYVLSIVYDEMKQPDKALAYFKEYNKLNDSIRNEENSSKLLNLQIALETQKKEQEIELLKKETIIETNKKTAYAIGATLLTILALVVISRQRLKHRKEKNLAESELEKNSIKQRALKLELENMELELTYNKQSLLTYTQNLIEKNEMLEKLKEQVNELELTNKDNDQIRIEKINELTESRIITDEDWEEFKKLYNKVYPSFMIRIKEMYPAITQAEVRLAALIGLKLASKEIASMIGISVDSVKKGRQRLRKKMELETDNDLDSHILALHIGK